MLRAILNTTINKNPGTTCARRPGQQEDLDVHVYICPINLAKAQQLALFEEATAISTSTVVGLRVILPGRFCICGHNIGVLGSSAGPHANRVTCDSCNVVKSLRS